MSRANVPEPVADEVDAGQVGAEAAGGVFISTLVELQRCGRVHTPAGQNALALATRIDAGFGDTGASIAALSKQHLASLAEAVKDIQAVGDPIDELKERRKARGG